MRIIAYRVFRSMAFPSNDSKQYGVARILLRSEFRWSRTVLNVKTIQKRLNAGNQPKVSRETAACWVPG